jgi:hypothetical protein
LIEYSTVFSDTANLPLFFIYTQLSISLLSSRRISTYLADLIIPGGSQNTGRSHYSGRSCHTQIPGQISIPSIQQIFKSQIRLKIFQDFIIKICRTSPSKSSRSVIKILRTLPSRSSRRRMASSRSETSEAAWAQIQYRQQIPDVCHKRMQEEMADLNEGRDTKTVTLYHMLHGDKRDEPRNLRSRATSLRQTKI